MASMQILLSIVAALNLFGMVASWQSIRAERDYAKRFKQAGFVYHSRLGSEWVRFTACLMGMIAPIIAIVYGATLTRW